MLPKRAQVVVIGGGVFGTSAAFHLAKEGEAAEFIDHAELRKRAPLVEAPADARMVLIPRDGYVEPRSVAAALAAAARDRGVTIRTRVEVTAIEARDGAVHGVVTPEG